MTTSLLEVTIIHTQDLLAAEHEITHQSHTTMAQVELSRQVREVVNTILTEMGIELTSLNDIRL